MVAGKDKDSRTNLFSKRPQNGKSQVLQKLIELAMFLQVWKGPLGSRRLSLPVFLDNRHIALVRLLAQSTGCLYLLGISLVLVSIRD
jgi:hypothetical protein